MITQRLLAERLFDGEQFHHNRAVVIENDIVVGLEAPKGDETPLPGLLVPGFIDVQVNGGGGVLFNATPTEQGLRQIMASHSRYGSTAILPTLISDSVAVMSQAADAISGAIAAKLPGILGIHFEGPHLSETKKGVHSSEHIRALSAAEKAIFSRDDLGIKVVTVAPENVSPEDIAFLVEHHVRVCLGHSNGTYEQARLALAAGATGFTHLYNAMSPLTSREPGMVGAALADQNSWCGLIVDGHHVHPAAAKVAIAAKPRGKMMLVSDAMPPVGSDETEFELLGTKVVRSGDRLNAVTGPLAGSVLDMAGAVKKAVEGLELPLAEALRMASMYPAAFLGLSQQLGQIKAGAKASFVLLDKQLAVKQCWIDGQAVY